MQDYFFKALLQSQAFNWDVCVLVAQSCSALYNPVDCSPPGSSVHGISQDFPGNPGFPRGLPFPPPGDLPNPGIEPWSPALRADSLPSEPPGKPLNWDS